MLPDYEPGGYLPPGIHAVSLEEVLARYGTGTATRERCGNLLRLIVEAARPYATIKRVLIWGSFVTTKSEPNDLDYSIVVSIEHSRAVIAPEHRRFFVPADAKQFYGVDRGYLVLPDYPPEKYAEKVIFLCETRELKPCGIVEISVHGEFAGAN